MCLSYVSFFKLLHDWSKRLFLWQGIASGYPLAGIAATDKLFDKLAPGTLVCVKTCFSPAYSPTAVWLWFMEPLTAWWVTMMMQGGTYGGNAVACAAAVATIDAIRGEDILENTVARGQQLMKGAWVSASRPGLAYDPWWRKAA
jgi:glutamate-1-semialdehyde aminotransferase